MNVSQCLTIFQFHVQKYQFWVKKIPNGALSRDLNLPNSESKAVSQTAIQHALCPETSKSQPDWPEDMGVGREGKESIFELICIIFFLDPVLTQD